MKATSVTSAMAVPGTTAMAVAQTWADLDEETGESSKHEATPLSRLLRASRCLLHPFPCPCPSCHHFHPTSRQEVHQTSRLEDPLWKASRQTFRTPCRQRAQKWERTWNPARCSHCRRALWPTLPADHRALRPILRVASAEVDLLEYPRGHLAVEPWMQPREAARRIPEERS